MAEYKNQHTVPEFHLRHFLPDAGQQVLWQYSKSHPARPRRVSPRDASAESYFYSTQRKDGTWDHTLEKARGVAETVTAPAMNRLIQNQPPKRGDRQLIAQYIGLMFVRTRGPRDNAASYMAELQSPQFAVDLLEQHWDLFCAEFGEAEVGKFYSDAKEKGAGLTMQKNFQIVKPFERADFWGGEIIRMSWAVWEAPASSFFVISDNPAFARDPRKLKAEGILGIGRDDLNVELGFPLSSRSFLIAKWGDGPILERRSCTRMRVLALNTRTVLSALDEVYSPQKDWQIEALVKEHKDYRVQYVRFTREELLAMWPGIIARRRTKRKGLRIPQ
jgi:Protein of unknown function (DUF4238)